MHEAKDDFAGRYRLIRRLGAGGMGQVFLAEQVGPKGFRRQVVIKRIHQHMRADKAMLASFEDEARVAALLDHPNIARIEDFGEADGSPYIVMEFVRGWELKDLVRRAKGLGRVLPPLGPPTPRPMRTPVSPPSPGPMRRPKPWKRPCPRGSPSAGWTPTSSRCASYLFANWRRESRPRLEAVLPP